MSSKKLRVLLPEASARQVLPMARAFYKLGCHVTTVQERKSALGYQTRYAHKRLCVQGVESDRELAESFYRELLLHEAYDLIVPLSDFSAEIFSCIKADVERNGITHVATNDLSVFMTAYDKLQTMRVCMEYGIPCPRTFDFDGETDSLPEGVMYPVIVKPRSSCGSIGLHIVKEPLALQKALDAVKQAGLGAALVQEFVPQNGRQYNAHFVLDAEHKVKTAVIAEKCRWFPLDGGASTLCRTIHNEHILEICTQLLQTIGWVGYCDIDLMEDPRDGSVRVIEINARISANVKLCFAAGINIAKQLMQLYFGDIVEENLSYREDVRLRCMHTDLLWFLKSPNRWRARPSYFSCKRTVDQIFSWGDFKPFFAFSFQALFKYKREMKKRER